MTRPVEAGTPLERRIQEIADAMLPLTADQTATLRALFSPSPSDGVPAVRLTDVVREI